MPTGETDAVPPGVRKMLTQLEPYPACVQNSRYDILGYNRVYGNLLTDLDMLPPEDRNCLWLSFTHPEWRAAMPDRDETVRLMAARFRSRMAEHLAEPAWKAMLKRLERGSQEFREMWQRHEVVRAVDQSKRFLNPLVGMMHFTYHGPVAQPRRGRAARGVRPGGRGDPGARRAAARAGARQGRAGTGGSGWPLRPGRPLRPGLRTVRHVRSRPGEGEWGVCP